MFTLIKPSIFRYCHQNVCKLSAVTNNYVTHSNNWRRNEHFTRTPYCLSTNQITSKETVTIPFNQGPRCVHTTGALMKSDQFSHALSKGISVFKDVNFKDLSNAPSSTLIFGLGGLIPFVAAPVSFLLFGYSPSIAFAQVAYGATILAFVGGVKWGHALGTDKPSIENIGLSTVPSLVAWVGLLVPQPLGILIIASGLGAAVYVDMLTSHYPSWFRALRCLLTSTAIISLLTTLLCSL